HTSWPRDWSSDVCSSDLKGPGIQLIADGVPTSVDIVRADPLGCSPPPLGCPPGGTSDPRNPGVPLRMIGYFAIITSAAGQSYVRSEERRVGKEGRAGWST